MVLKLNKIGEKKMDEQKPVAPIKPEDIPAITEQLQRAPQQAIVPVQPEEKVLGLNKFRQEMMEDQRMVLPFLKLVQSMSDDFTQDNIPPGHFRNSLTGEDLGPEAIIYPVAVFHWRRYFEDRNVMCSSNDSLQGYGDPGGECKICPLRKWVVRRANGEEELVQNATRFRAKKDEEMIAPLCSEQFVFPCMILTSEWRVPGALVFHRSYLNEGLRLYGMIEFAPDDTAYKLVSIKTTNAKGTWFVPRLTIARKLTVEEQAICNKFKGNLRDATVDIDLTEEEE